MARLTFILSILFMMHSSYASSQNIKNTIVSLNENNATLVDIFNKITNITNFNFTYSRYIVEKNDRFDAVYQKQSLEYVLTDLGKRAGFSFKVDDTDIMIAENPVKVGFKELKLYQKRVNGTVTDALGEPLLGATVLEKGTSNGVSTDFDGRFTIDLKNENAVLVVSYIGFITQEIAIANRTSFEVSLVADVSSLNEVVVIGYGQIARRDVTGSVVKISSKDLKDQATVGFDQNLVGRVAGVNVQQTTGAPGGNVAIRIRGTGSISAGNSPLIVIDGFPISDSYATGNVQGNRPGRETLYENPQNPLNSLNPNDIESIEVLKDASASAIYGSRGANGVIIITTKKGATGKAKINFNSYSGIQRVTNTYDMMDAYTYAEQQFISYQNSGLESNFPAYLMPYLNDVPGLTDTDWQDELFRDAAIQNYDLSVRGGNESLKYFVSGNYFNQDGIVLGSGFKRYSFRTNLDAQVTEKIKLTLSLNPSVSESDLVGAENPYFVDGVVNLALLAIPTDAVYNPDGTFNFNQNTAAGSGPFVNPIALATGVKDDLTQSRILGNLKLSADLMHGLKYISSFGVDLNNFERSYYRPSWIPFRGATPPNNPEGRAFTTGISNWIFENTLNYEVPLNNQKLSLLAGFSAQKEQINRSGIFATDFPNDLVTTINAGTVTSAYTETEEWSLLSYFARAIYNYDDRYYANIAVRRDGSSRFGDNNKWGFFPSASVAWRISNESFFTGGSSINDLKLRASYGVTGNFSIPNYGSVALLGQNNYVLDGNQINGLAPSTSPNPNLSWEKTEQLDLGLDVGLFEDKIYLNADYFVSNTKDLLINLPVAGTTGFETSLQNVGEVKNTGFELGITGYFNLGDIKWTLSGNIATLKNEVVSLGSLTDPIIANGGVTNTHITQVGSPIGSYYGYKVLGVFMSQDEINNNPSVTTTAVGDFRFADINGDGIITPTDRTILGDFFPDYTFGINSQMEYKNWDFNFTIQGSQGFEIFHLQQRYLASLQTFSNYRADVFRNSYISPQQPGNGQVYRPNANVTGNNQNISSYHVEDGSYIRLRSITLGYTLSNSTFFESIGLSSFRVYLTGQNLFTITNYPGYNPEVSSRPSDTLTQGEDYGTYPLAKSVIFGINVNF